MMTPRTFLRDLFDAAVARAAPASCLASQLPEKPAGRCLVLGAGKAAAAMARAVEEAWPDVDLSGLVITRYGHRVPTRRIEVVEAAHPVPDRAGLEATRRLLQMAEQEADLVLVLISGGGSALLTQPVEGLSVDDKIAVHRALLSSGLPIGQMNRVRRHLSTVKGGGLLEVLRARRVVTLLISDVPGDSPADIASGPTVAPGDGAALPDLADRLAGAIPQAAERRLRLARAVPQVRADGDIRLVASPLQSLQSAAELARAHGITPLILGDALEGEAAPAGVMHAGIAASIARHGLPLGAPAVVLSGGETTVSVGSAGAGRGGRNTEFLLALACALQGHRGIHALAADTDGIDGTEDAAGAICGPDTLSRLSGLGLSAADLLARHDSYTAFEHLEDLVITGPTLTNVNDFRAILVLPPE